MKSEKFLLEELINFIDKNPHFSFLPSYEVKLKNWKFKDEEGKEGEIDLVGVIDSKFLGSDYMLADLFEIKSMDNKNLKRAGCYQLNRAMHLLDSDLVVNDLYVYTPKALYSYKYGELTPKVFISRRRK